MVYIKIFVKPANDISGDIKTNAIKGSTALSQHQKIASEMYV